MILEGFEIENWSCIKHVAVDNLPATGVIVLHGPNGTGKTSIIEALRACLIDSKSTFKALGRGIPKNSSEKPRVRVTFRAQGEAWQIAKQFGSKQSELKRRTSSGEWKLETSDASEAHERTRSLLGCGSDLGLHQLLWLTQGEFRLPAPKEFDAGVQAQLRAVLGVLQTDLDDRFLRRVKDGWAAWFHAASKPGEKPRRKKDCALERGLAALELQRNDVQLLEEKYRGYEQMLERSSDLEVLVRQLLRQLEAARATRAELYEEYERSLKPLEAHRLAVEHVAAAQKLLETAESVRQKREQAEKHLERTEDQTKKARRELAERSQQLRDAEQRNRELNEASAALRGRGRELQRQRDEAMQRLQLLALDERLAAARARLERAEATTRELASLEQEGRAHPAPGAATLAELEANRTQASQLQADLDAAAMSVELTLEPGALPPRVQLDGSAATAAERYLVRHRAEIAIPGWGRVCLKRGGDARSLEQIEQARRALDRAFADGLAPFGLSATDAAALARLRALAADQKARAQAVRHSQEELQRLAPAGLAALRREVAELENRKQAADLSLPQRGLPGPVNLERLTAQLQKQLTENAQQLEKTEAERSALELSLDGMRGLRRRETDAKEAMSALEATAALRRGELERMLTPAQIEEELHGARERLERAQHELEVARLSDGELTIRARLDAADDGLKALEERLAEARKELHRIEGALQQTEGLHQERSAAAVRLGKLTRETEREQLEADAYDRLYALFEECRDRQLGAVMGPIHQRVLRWMRLLRISSYESIRFNDQFLPERLVAGAVELPLGEESTGTIEQVALMVRLALGATLSSAAEPAVAVLDDPLTHSDVVRLDRMRAVLKSAAAGEPDSLPPAGPLQIAVFTCHPEWFAVDGCRTIDLTKPEVLTRSW